MIESINNIKPNKVWCKYQNQQITLDLIKVDINIQSNK